MGSKLHWTVQPIQPIIPFPVVNLWPNQVHILSFRQNKEFIPEDDLQDDVRDLQEEVRELQENLKVMREEIDAVKISTTRRPSNPIYDTIDEDGNIVEEEDSGQERIAFNRLSVPGEAVNLNTRQKRDAAPSRKMGKRYVILWVALFISSIVIAVIAAVTASKIQVLFSVFSVL